MTTSTRTSGIQMELQMNENVIKTADKFDENVRIEDTLSDTIVRHCEYLDKEIAKKISINIKFITPKEAGFILATFNSNNRDRRKCDIKFYADQMKQPGKWMPSVLMFDENGELLDGQNRLAAVIASGCGHSFVVIDNLPSDYKYILNTGNPVNNTDKMEMFLRQKGYNTKTLWSVAVNAYGYELKYQHHDHEITRNAKSIEAFVDENSELFHEIDKISAKTLKNSFSNTIIPRALEFTLRKKYGRIAEDFFAEIYDGNPKNNTSLEALRVYLKDRPAFAKSHSGNDQHVAIMMAFDAWVYNKELNVIAPFQEKAGEKQMVKNEFFVVNYIKNHPTL